jgi:hypothetical protein
MPVSRAAQYGLRAHTSIRNKLRRCGYIVQQGERLVGHRSEEIIAARASGKSAYQLPEAYALDGFHATT